MAYFKSSLKYKHFKHRDKKITNEKLFNFIDKTHQICVHAAMNKKMPPLLTPLSALKECHIMGKTEVTHSNRVFASAR